MYFNGFVITVLAIFIESFPDQLGALSGGSPMSHVDLKKWQCRMSLSLAMSHATLFLATMSHVTTHYVTCRI